MIDKRVQSEVEHAFIEFVDKIQNLGFKFDMFDKLVLTYTKGEAADFPHSVNSKLQLQASDFIKKED
tara:strand:- start:3461 stop:3661 length:201 start_codon:yes stop_codon:yes gene_type:complete